MTTSRILFTSMILCLASTAPVQATTIAHWQFGGTPNAVASGVGTVLEQAGNHNGTPFGDPTYRSLAGGGSGLEFDGNDGVDVPDSPAFASPSLTVEAIVSVDAVIASQTQFVFRGDTQNGKDPFYLGLVGNRIRWAIEGPVGGIVAIDSLVDVVLDEFFHVAGTIDDATGDMRLFINGVQVGMKNTSSRPTFPISGGSLSLGYLFDGGGRGQNLDGILDEVRISNVALTSAQFLNANVVPEPGTSLLVLMGLMGVGRRVLGRRVPGVDRTGASGIDL